MRLPRSPTVVAPRIKWFAEEPDPTDDTLRWFTDASIMYPKVPELTTAAVAFVVVTADGALCACAEVALPSNFKNAPAAEAAVVQGMNSVGWAWLLTEAIDQKWAHSSLRVVDARVCM